MNTTDTVDGKLMTQADFIAEAKRWANVVRAQAKANAAAFTKGKKETHTYKKGWKAGKTEKILSTDINYSLKNKNGEISSIAFKFPLHGIYRAMGVGRGQPAPGSNKKEAKKIYVRRSMSDWMSKPIEDNIDKLADLAVECYGDQVLQNVYGMGKLSKIRNI
jgi:hypothetical protein